MRRLSFLFKPGWLALTVVVVAFAAFCFTALAPWQLGKNSSTSDRNERIAAASSTEPVPWGSLVTPGQVPDVTDEWRPVEVTGTYLADSEVLARLRISAGKPSYEVLTPFRVTTGPGAGTTVLVDRGYVVPVQGTDAPPVEPAPGGTQEIVARLRLDEPWDPQRGVVADPGTSYPQVYAVSADLVTAATGTTMTPGYLQLQEGSPGALGVLPLPQLDAGPYLSYGLQWIAFGIMAPAGLLYFVRAEILERRRGRGESTDDTDTDGAETTSTPGASAEVPRRRRRTSRKAMVAAAVRDGAIRQDDEPPTSVRGSRPDALADRYGRR